MDKADSYSRTKKISQLNESQLCPKEFTLEKHGGGPGGLVHVETLSGCLRSLCLRPGSPLTSAHHLFVLALVSHSTLFGKNGREMGDSDVHDNDL